jgi:hypothetical protein
MIYTVPVNLSVGALLSSLKKNETKTDRQTITEVNQLYD